MLSVETAFSVGTMLYAWQTLGYSANSSSTPIGCRLNNGNITLVYPDHPNFHSEDFRMVLMKIE